MAMFGNWLRNTTYHLEHIQSLILLIWIWYDMIRLTEILGIDTIKVI